MLYDESNFDCEFGDKMNDDLQQISFYWQKIQNAFLSQFQLLKNDRKYIEKQMDEIEKEKEALQIEKQNWEIQKNREKEEMMRAIEQEKEEWLAEKQQIQKINAIKDDIIELNVSGVTDGFTVTKSLLRTFPGSYLDIMFSGKFEVQKV